MADSFKYIYKILKILEKSMEYEEFDSSIVGYNKLGISKALWTNLIIILLDARYITGVAVESSLDGTLPDVDCTNISITLKGLEYLEENSLMRKAANIAKGIKDVTPFI